MFTPLLQESRRTNLPHRAEAPRKPRAVTGTDSHDHTGCACGGGCPRCAAALLEARVDDPNGGRVDDEKPTDSRPVDRPIPMDAPTRNRPADDAADCVNGGGSSVCNPNTGNYDIDPPTNTCCTKGCTELHEREHVKDMDGWGCCKGLFQKVVPAQRAGGDLKCFVDTFQRWLDVVTPLTECHANAVSVSCADRLSREKGCDTDAGKRTVCCKKIKEYRDAKEQARRDTCGRAPKQAPPCPNYDHCRATAPPAAPAAPKRP